MTKKVVECDSNFTVLCFEFNRIEHIYIAVELCLEKACFLGTIFSILNIYMSVLVETSGEF